MTEPCRGLPARIEALFEAGAEADEADARSAVAHLVEGLTRGTIRSAHRVDGRWEANAWVKKGILLGFRFGRMEEVDPEGPFSFSDKDTFPVRSFAPEDGVRVVPGGSAVRVGAYVGPGVVCMPPMYINVGAWVGEDSMVDSHALVGSCAQIGSRVHLSAGAQIGGVLEPVGAVPVIIEDDALIGGNTGIFEGTLVGAGAVVAPGTILSRGTPVYDLVEETVYRAEGDAPLTIPAGAVVVPGSRPARGSFAAEHGLTLQSAVIVKYRDEGTDAATALEEALR